MRALPSKFTDSPICHEIRIELFLVASVYPGPGSENSKHLVNNPGGALPAESDVSQALLEQETRRDISPSPSYPLAFVPAHVPPPTPILLTMLPKAQDICTHKSQNLTLVGGGVGVKSQDSSDSSGRAHHSHLLLCRSAVNKIQDCPRNPLEFRVTQIEQEALQKLYVSHSCRAV